MSDLYEISDEFAKELKEKFPLLYPNRVWIEYSTGWYDLIRNLSSEIYELYNKWGPKYSEVPYVVQMKEKFGGLRYYTTYGELEEEDCKAFRDIVDKYERMSFTVCERCSKPGKNGTTGDSYWYATLCDTCREIEQKKMENKI